MTTISVIKVSGHELDDPTFLGGLTAALRGFQQPLVLVHGGGKEISAAVERAGLQIEFVDGLRVTSPAVMDIMQMVVCGTINKRIVTALVNAGVKAIGLSGLDLGLLRCEPYRPAGRDLGRVGEVTAVDGAALLHLLALGWMPVIAPVALGATDGLSYNVNADMVAEAVAGALAGAELVFVSNVPGVLVDGRVVPALTPAAVEELIANGVISGGMIPKVRAALAALQRGASSVRIVNLAGLHDGGTRFTHGELSE
ncbi:MAG TPA: acetylglutamate kinase [Chloroflexus aurantiacus]|jgi:acetylglutamate kinase|uniref:Acetylglutamate kinase n=2 Tax=Chloroflexus aurantiacus TaxID=1108 RepID=ARGB_CHLAA|nr:MULTISPECIES: acetylglutamate kinase [Chloroflexus]A9WKG4.1 RecName: Full=Acetylglutamate kinase; AltName: Full=N-acetyl-L-glutamate 5-phosphotransferase; AltName: Full=NAG kinase; Short=NAGK [Chloroflexus aurantiacus J-10-fl]B9LDR9.1 RecName: Full=Acetylglutamate kinase; AltName: Full=N-acetyl-L-glutamate 5-phosphotransferase; AltName: Full=NAG kinase; Short=NAGK [Chloroflexus aurantiacus Y-400-fl]ABY36592.1 acetylglutamate kinase [Chloroflexus aurantiacus J-10-fl]GIV95182.1 MAG: acetylglut